MEAPVTALTPTFPKGRTGWVARAVAAGRFSMRADFGFRVPCSLQIRAEQQPRAGVRVNMEPREIPAATAARFTTRAQCYWSAPNLNVTLRATVSTRATVPSSDFLMADTRAEPAAMAARCAKLARPGRSFRIASSVLTRAGLAE